MRWAYFREDGLFVGPGVVEAGGNPCTVTGETVRHAVEHPGGHPDDLASPASAVTSTPSVFVVRLPHVEAFDIDTRVIPNLQIRAAGTQRAHGQRRQPGYLGRDLFAEPFFTASVSAEGQTASAAPGGRASQIASLTATIRSDTAGKRS